MSIWFLGSILGLTFALPLHFRSVEHTELEERHGVEGGTRLANLYGIVSGRMESLFLVGLWVSPQPRFATLPTSFYQLEIPLVGISIPLPHAVIGLPLLLTAAWIAIPAVRLVGLRVAETHGRPQDIKDTGPYSIVRHPQYLGADLAHIGACFLFSAWYALLFTPIYVFYNYLIAWKEEKELVREFGTEYTEYCKSVPMFLPRVSW